MGHHFEAVRRVEQVAVAAVVPRRTGAKRQLFCESRRFSGRVALAEVSAEYFPLIRDDSYFNVAVTAQAGLGFDIRLL